MTDTNVGIASPGFISGFHIPFGDVIARFRQQAIRNKTSVSTSWTNGRVYSSTWKEVATAIDQYSEPLFLLAELLRRIPSYEKLYYRDGGQWLEVIVVLKDDTLAAHSAVVDAEIEVSKVNSTVMNVRTMTSDVIDGSIIDGYRSL